MSGTAMAIPAPAAPVVDAAPTATARISNITDWLVFDRLNDRPTGSGQVGAMGGSMALAANGDLAQLSGAAGPATALPNGAWLRGIGSFLSASGRGSITGYQARTGGFLAGFDHPLDDRLTLGVAAGYSRTKIAENTGSSGTIETPRVMVYGRYAHGAFAIDASAGAAYDRVHTARPLFGNTVAVESHNGFEETAALQANYRLSMRNVTVVPLVGLQFAHLSENKFAEAGADGADVSGNGSTTDSLQAMVGATAFGNFVTSDGTALRPGGRLTIGRELLGTSRTLAVTTPGGFVTDARAASPSRTTITMGPSFAAQMSQRLALTADYQVELGLGRSIAHDVFLGARYSF